MKKNISKRIGKLCTPSKKSTYKVQRNQKAFQGEMSVITMTVAKDFYYLPHPSSPVKHAQVGKMAVQKKTSLILFICYFLDIIWRELTYRPLKFTFGMKLSKSSSIYVLSRNKSRGQGEYLHFSNNLTHHTSFFFLFIFFKARSFTTTNEIK